MPMDKYARQSHKTNQRARRRNNTAQYVLENQLRQLDRDLRGGQVAYQRNLNRVKSELSNLEGISSDFDLPLHDQAKRIEPADIDNTNDTPQAYSGYVLTRPNGVNHGTSAVITDKLKDASPSSTSLSKNNGYDIENAVDYPSARGHSSNTHVHSISTLQNDLSRISLHNQTASNRDKLISCEYYNSNRRVPQKCYHFPCKLPQTYHTLGFRRDDLCPHNDDFDNDNDAGLSPLDSNLTPVDILSEKRSGKINDQSTDNNDNNNNITTMNTRRSHDKNENNNINTKWIKTNEGPKYDFNPMVRGPMFGFRPSDPVLERIRQHRKEPKLNATRPCARVTIRDRIRGVKQLVKEMKMSNERIKPEDWATNYGKRVPTRVLLNPVVPV